MYVYIYTHCYCQTQLRHTLNKTYGCNGSRKTDSAIGQCFVSVETHRPTVTSKSVCRTTEPGRNRSLSVSTSSVCVPDATEHGETMERLRFSARKASHGGEETGAASCQGKCQGAWSTSPRLATSLLDKPNTPPPLQLERCSRLLAHALERSSGERPARVMTRVFGRVIETVLVSCQVWWWWSSSESRYPAISSTRMPETVAWSLGGGISTVRLVCRYHNSSIAANKISCRCKVYVRR